MISYLVRLKVFLFEPHTNHKIYDFPASFLTQQKAKEMVEIVWPNATLTYVVKRNKQRYVSLEFLTKDDLDDQLIYDQLASASFGQ